MALLILFIMKLSVIIPSYNRLDNLDLCLEKLSRQTLGRENFEIIIIDDGSDNYEEKIIVSLFDKFNLSGKYFRQEKEGPAAARNRGVKLASGEIILFTGDDMMATENFLQIHYNFHCKYSADNFAMLGRVAWPLEWEITDFMKWLDTTGFQFDFASLKAGEETDFKHFYTSNISLKKEFLVDNGLFNEDFPYAAFEDTELGYRLWKRGLKLIYQPESLVYHYHRLDLGSYSIRTERAGVSAVILSRIHPELEDQILIKTNIKFYFKNIIKLVICLFGKIFRINKWRWHCYSLKILKHYVRGCRKEQKNISNHS